MKLSGTAPGGFTVDCGATHLAAAPAAARARVAGSLMREAMRRTEREYAALFDAATGAPLGERAKGLPDQVSIEPILRRCPPGHRSIAVHSHPHRLPFSLKDAAVLPEQPALWALAVIGRDGSWYVLSVAPGHPTPTTAALRATMQQQLLAIASQSTVPPFAGPLAARREHWPAAWERAAPTLGWRYDRVRGNQSNA